MPSRDVLQSRPFGDADGPAPAPCRTSDWLGQEFHGVIPAGTRQLRYAAFAPHGQIRPASYLVYIAGGPGSRVLSGFDLAPGPKLLIQILAERCRSVVLVPAYTGTADGSNYPASSFEDAVADVDEFLRHARKVAQDRPVIAVSASLGSYLYASSSKGQVDAHLGLVPLLRSPADFMTFVINDRTPGGRQDLARNIWKSYDVGPRRAPQIIRAADFTRAFFGQSQALTVTLADAYRRRPPTTGELRRTRLFAGELDLEAGRFREFRAALQPVGLSLHQLPKAGHAVDGTGLRLIMEQAETILPAVCSPKPGK